MQILLASAKIMNSTNSVQTPETHLPRFHKEARQMALEMGELSVEELAKVIPCNEKIALENKLRYQDFFNDEAFLPALLAYYGQAYKCLKAQEYSQDDFSYADKQLRITRFLYGLIRHLDLIHHYPSAEGKNMFAYWKPYLTDILVDAVKADDGILVHLATEEFQHLFDWKRILKEVQVIQPLFMVDQGSRLKAVSVYAKSCRGAMTSFILRNQLAKPEEFLAFEYDGFNYDKNYGDESHPHFILKV